MPSSSIGFWVASTMNGLGSGWMVPAIEVCRSCIASSSADWVFALARLISSSSTKLRVHRPELGLELVSPRVVDLGADDVARQQVGRALDPRELGADGLRERRRRERLRQARHALEEHVPFGQQRDQQRRTDPLLADDPARPRGGDPVDRVDRAGDVGRGEGRARLGGPGSGHRRQTYPSVPRREPGTELLIAPQPSEVSVATLSDDRTEHRLRAGAGRWCRRDVLPHLGEQVGADPLPRARIEGGQPSEELAYGERQTGREARQVCVPAPSARAPAASTAAGAAGGRRGRGRRRCRRRSRRDACRAG